MFVLILLGFGTLCFGQDESSFAENWAKIRNQLEHDQNQLGQMLSNKDYQHSERVPEMKKLSENLTYFERQMILEKYGPSVWWSLPNVYFGIGSWIEGDTNAGLIIAGGWVTTVILAVGGGSLQQNGYETAGIPMLISALFAYGATLIYSVAAPIWYADEQGREIRQVLYSTGQ